MAIKYTFEVCKAEAAKYPTKTEWVANHPSSYKAAHRQGWIDLCCEHMAILLRPSGYWTLARCKVEAAKFQSRAAWQIGHPASYQAARKQKLVAECTPHIKRVKAKNGHWTLGRCKEDALKFESRVAWERNSLGAYSAACKNKWLDLCCTHMQSKKPELDSLYLWLAEGETYNGKLVCKIGATSSFAYENRIQRCAKSNNMVPKLLVQRYVGAWCVKALERYLLTFGEDPKLDVPDGRTEFRALTDEELQVIIKIIESHPIL